MAGQEIIKSWLPARHVGQGAVIPGLENAEDFPRTKGAEYIMRKNTESYLLDCCFFLALTTIGLFPLPSFLKTCNISSASSKGTVIKEKLSNILTSSILLSSILAFCFSNFINLPRVIESALPSATNSLAVPALSTDISLISL